MRRWQGYHRSASNDSVLFLFFIVTQWGQQVGGVEVVLIPRRHQHAMYYQLRQDRWQHPFFNFLLLPIDHCIIVCSTLYYCWKRDLWQCAFYFLLLSVDNKGNIEARSSSYPSAHFVHMTAWLFYFNWYCNPTATTTNRFARLHSYPTAPLTEFVFIFNCYQKTTTVYYYALSFISSILCLSLYLLPLVASKHLTIGFIIFSAFLISYCLLLSSTEA